MNYKKHLLLFIAIFTLVLFPFSSIFASEEAEKEGFQAGPFIIGHIIDDYGWHITDVKGHSISIPLPIILFDNGKPVVFMSSKFHHGEHAYKGYALGFTEESKGKIVKLEDPTIEHLEKGATYAYTTDGLIDVSITKNVCSLLISIILICCIFISVANRYKKGADKAPKGLQALLEILIIFVRDELVRPSIGEKKYEKYLPYLLTLFFFIFLNNLMGLIPIFPGGANLTGNIAVTGILALITFFITSFSANKNYWVHIVNTPGVPWWLKFPLPIMPIVETIGIFTKPFVLMIRLFANITAGHIIVLGFIGLIFIFGEMNPAIGFAVSPVSIIMYLFMGLLELIVAFVQAFVFTLLSSLYIGMAVEEHEEHGHEEVAEAHVELANNEKK